MLDIIKWIGSIFVDLYNLLDINIFPDMSVSYIDIVIGICLFVVLLRFFFGFFRSVDFSIVDSIKGIFKGYTSKNSSEGYMPKHGNRR